MDLPLVTDADDLLASFLQTSAAIFATIWLFREAEVSFKFVGPAHTLGLIRQRAIIGGVSYAIVNFFDLPGFITSSTLLFVKLLCIGLTCVHGYCVVRDRPFMGLWSIVVLLTIFPTSWFASWISIQLAGVPVFENFHVFFWLAHLVLFFVSLLIHGREFPHSSSSNSEGTAGLMSGGWYAASQQSARYEREHGVLPPATALHSS